MTWESNDTIIDIKRGINTILKSSRDICPNTMIMSHTIFNRLILMQRYTRYILYLKFKHGWVINKIINLKIRYNKRELVYYNIQVKRR